MTGWLAWIGWGLFLLALIILFIQQRRHINFRMSLSAYAKWLLLDDEIRNNHKDKFINFLQNEKLHDDQDLLFLMSDRAIEEMAISLKEAGSLLTVQEMMRKYIQN